MQGAKERVDHRPPGPGIPLGVRPLEPLEREVCRASRRVRLRNLIGGDIGILLGEFLKRRVRFGPAARGVMDDRQREEAERLRCGSRSASASASSV